MNRPSDYTHFVWNAVIAYLDERAGAASVRAHMADPPAKLRHNLVAIYEGLLSSLRNRQAMLNTIGDLGRLSPILCQFDPHAVVRLYGDDWRGLLEQAINSLLLRTDPDN